MTVSIRVVRVRVLGLGSGLEGRDGALGRGGGGGLGYG